MCGVQGLAGSKCKGGYLFGFDVEDENDCLGLGGVVGGDVIVEGFAVWDVAEEHAFDDCGVLGGADGATADGFAARRARGFVALVCFGCVALLDHIVFVIAIIRLIVVGAILFASALGNEHFCSRLFLVLFLLLWFDVELLMASNTSICE